MKDKNDLSLLDLQLYLAGAMPLSKRLLLAAALLVDGNLRKRLRDVRSGNDAFRKKGMDRLAARLYPKPASPAGHRPVRNFEVSHPRFFRWNPALAGSFALLLLCALPLLYHGSAGPREDFIAKGRGLGVNLFVKGDSAYRVENQAARISQLDTLQVVPLGSEAQHLVLLGWDARQGITRIFPREGGYSGLVSHDEPPPALLLQGLADNRLICVTAVAPFRVEEVESLLRRMRWQTMGPAPARLEGGMYLQIFTISKRDGRI